MALDFTALQTEFIARGFNYLDDAGPGTVRIKRFLNDAMHEIDDLFDWPYLLTSTSGATPLTIATLRRIQSVNATTGGAAMYQREWRDVAAYPGLASSGGTGVYYMTTPTTISTVSVSNVTVVFFQFGADLTAGGDAPLMPDRYRMAIVDYAVASALLDKDNPVEAQAARAQGDAIVVRMREALLSQSVQEQQTEVAGPREVRASSRERKWPVAGG